jgi:hypothetical protein
MQTMILTWPQQPLQISMSHWVYPALGYRRGLLADYREARLRKRQGRGGHLRKRGQEPVPIVEI